MNTNELPHPVTKLNTSLANIDGGID
jgi:hypothetical protein